jgi:signal transduction histidine kinase
MRDITLTNPLYNSSVLSTRVRSLSVRRVLPLFLLIVVGLAVYQVQLTWLLMEQDRNLTPKRIKDRLEQVADKVVQQIAFTTDTWAKNVRGLESLPPPDSMKAMMPPNATFILITPGSVALYPPKPLLFVPDPPPSASPPVESIKAADREVNNPKNYSRGNPCITCAKAIQALLPLAEQPGTRAEALLRIARLEQKMHHAQAALETYRRLSREPGISSSGAPYALTAAAERCDVFADSGEPQSAALEAASIRSNLLEGRWRLSKETFDYYWAELNRLRSENGAPPPALFELSSLVSDLYEEWNREPENRKLPQEVTALGTLGGPVGWSSNGDSWGRTFEPLSGSLLIWHGKRSRFSALLAPTLTVASKLPAAESDVRWRVVLFKDPRVTRSDPGTNVHVLRTLAESAQFPGYLELWSTEAESREHLNRTIWLAWVVLMLILVLGGAYALYRGLNKEFRVSQLQSDFVSAVSHEFRSPLTTLCTLTELLAENRIPDGSRRQESYIFLEREAARLKRLVDDLLDFGRMESARREYREELNELFALVRSAVADFQRDALATGFNIELNLDERPATINCDAQALRCAIRNLLENAVKYSPDCRTIWVDGAIKEHQTVISIRDRGIGVDPRERHEIFQKFVRGAAAKQAGIKGTGIGLSMVRQIVEAMGGQVRLEAPASVGSTFTIVLPLAGGETKA